MHMDYIISPDDCILITGASGFVGPRVVETLLDYGFTNIRCVVRPSSSSKALDGIIRKRGAQGTIELVKGDLLSRADCRKAAEGVAVIYHLAAGVEKSFAGAFMNSGLATRNLLDAFLAHGQPKRFVNVSSFAVYSNLNIKPGALLDETCPLEDSPQERFDAYCFGKLKQEEIVTEYGSRRNLPYVIVRPGTVFGPGKRELTGRIGVDTFGFFIHMGGSKLLPLTFVNNCAEAIVLAGIKPGIDHEVFNIVDDELLTSRQFLKAYKSRIKRFCSLPVPYFVAYALCVAWEKYSKASRGQLPPVFNRRRCAADWKRHRFSNAKARERLGWKPRVNMDKAMDAFVNQFESR